MTIDGQRASFQPSLPHAFSTSCTRNIPDFRRCPRRPGRSSRCRRRSGNPHFHPWPGNLGDYHFPSVSSPSTAGAQRYPPSSSSSSPTTTTTTSTMNRYHRRHHRYHRCRRRCRYNKQLTAVVADVWYTTDRQFRTPCVSRELPVTFLSLSLSLNPSSALVSPSPTFRRARAIDSPPLAINRSSPRRVSRCVAIVDQERPALARPHIAAPFCVPSRARTVIHTVDDVGVTEERRARSAAAVAVAGVVARRDTLTTSPADQPKPASLHCSLPPCPFLSRPSLSLAVADWLLTVLGRAYA